ncbi:hypothetical protein B296_00024207 [Ensete ventricosum]|uniref:Uncharacterized protein n=1 Tax=Ensete ventricosum TaxID=4639 RepID=A0A427ARM8_ENSVE|nr:hypothetical protein B296_00024207 [Ensete ventricosum]
MSSGTFPTLSTTDDGFYTSSTACFHLWTPISFRCRMTSNPTFSSFSAPLAVRTRSSASCCICSLEGQSIAVGSLPMSLGAMLFLPIESQSSQSLADSQPQPCLCQLLGPTLLLSTPPAMLLLRLLGFCFLLPDLIFGQSLLPLNDSVESSGFHPLTRRQSVPLWQQSPTATLLLLRGALAARPSPARDPVLLPGDCGLYVQGLFQSLCLLIRPLIPVCHRFYLPSCALL